MSMDRQQNNSISITQERSSLMLGVRRESITMAAAALQKDGMIDRTRGVLRLVDRPLLEKRVCECYLAIKQECEHLMPHPSTPKSGA